MMQFPPAPKRVVNLGAMAVFKVNQDGEIEVLGVKHDDRFSVPVATSPDFPSVMAKFRECTGLDVQFDEMKLYSVTAEIQNTGYVKVYFLERMIPFRTIKDIAYTRHNMNTMTRDILHYIEFAVPSSKDMEDIVRILMDD